jgi:uncharacterized membrane protein
VLDLGLAIGHHLIIFALFGILAAELVLVRRGISLDVITRIARVDIWYGVLAAATLWSSAFAERFSPLRAGCTIPTTHFSGPK